MSDYRRVSVFGGPRMDHGLLAARMLVLVIGPYGRQFKEAGMLMAARTSIGHPQVPSWRRLGHPFGSAK